jgi:hypothetical protein
MASFWYNSGLKEVLAGTVDLTSDTIKVAMTTSSYTPDGDAHDNFDDITNEVSGTGYSAGGETLASKSFTQDNTNNRGVFDADDVTWTSSTITNARYAIIYKSTGTASTSRLIALVDFGSNFSSSSSTFRIQWNASGILYLQAA